jgi:hypothetical protein
MCKKSGESINYLIFYCEVAKELWNVFFFLLV